MAYPGDGYKMSNYGLKGYTPDQKKEQWKRAVQREEKMHRLHTTTNKKLASSSASSSSELPEEVKTSLNYFASEKEYPALSFYDQTFHFDSSYNQKLKREDFQYTQGLDILGEESGRDVPALSSSVYGHRPPIEGMEKDYVRVGVVKRDFFRARGGVINTN